MSVILSLGLLRWAISTASSPLMFLKSEVEGVGLWTRGIPEIMEPVQNTVDWLINTHFYNVRTCAK